jgi:cyanophycin synthetase
MLSERLLRAGRPGRELGTRLDLLRALGPAGAWRRVRGDARLRELAGARGPLYREIWAEAAEAVGAELVDLGDDFLELRRGGRWTRVRHERVMLDDLVSVDLSEDKALVHRLLGDARIPVPEHVEYTLDDLEPAAAFVERNAPCVVKPAAATDVGVGVTGGITTRAELVRASLRAARANARLLVERQAQGGVYRLLLLDGELLDTVVRRPPRIVGDGRSTIEQLLEAENRRRLDAHGRAGLWLLKVDLDTVLALERQGLSARSVPAAGELVTVKTVTNQGRIEDAETVRETVAPGLVAEVARAAETVGLRLAGVDLVAPDLSRSLADSGGVVLEVNCTPGLHHHYLVSDHEAATRVAIPLLERLLA